MALAAVLVAGCLRWPPVLRLGAGAAALLAVLLALGAAATHLTPPDNTLARVAPSVGFWLMALAFALMLADALARMNPALWLRWLILAGAVAAIGAILGSGALDGVSVMREYAARQDIFLREARAHLTLAFGSLALALLIGLPLGRGAVSARARAAGTGPVSAEHPADDSVTGAFRCDDPGLRLDRGQRARRGAGGVAGIGLFPRWSRCFFYSLLPVVSNTLTGLTGVNPATREAAIGLGLTRTQLLAQVLIPLALPVLLAAVRIVLVQTIGLAVIAGLIGGGGFGTLRLQGLEPDRRWTWCRWAPCPPSRWR